MFQNAIKSFHALIEVHAAGVAADHDHGPIVEVGGHSPPRVIHLREFAFYGPIGMRVLVHLHVHDAIRQDAAQVRAPPRHVASAAA